MGAYSFQKQFLSKILSGEKRHTIRGIRRYPDKPGSTLSLYYAMRTKHCRLLFRAPCVKVELIYIFHSFMKHDFVIGLASMPDETGYSEETRELSPSEKEQLARCDGFSSFSEMMKFWIDKNELPFEGHIIHWDYERRTKKRIRACRQAVAGKS